MGPAELLAHLAPGDLRRDEAARRLSDLLRHLCRLSLRAANGQAWRIDPILLDEVVSDVTFAVIKRAASGSLDVGSRGDRAASAYLARALVNRWISLKRKKVSEQATEEEGLEKAAGSVADGSSDSPEVDMAAMMARARALVEDAVRYLRGMRQERYQTAVDTAWAQVDGLVFGSLTMTDILKRWEHLAPESDPGAIEAAKNRIWKQHERLRRGLLEAVDRQVHRGEIDRDVAEMTEKAIIGLLKRVSGDE